MWSVAVILIFFDVLKTFFPLLAFHGNVPYQTRLNSDSSSLSSLICCFCSSIIPTYLCINPDISQRWCNIPICRHRWCWCWWRCRCVGRVEWNKCMNSSKTRVEGYKCMNSSKTRVEWNECMNSSKTRVEWNEWMNSSSEDGKCTSKLETGICFQATTIKR